MLKRSIHAVAGALGAMALAAPPAGAVTVITVLAGADDASGSESRPAPETPGPDLAAMVAPLFTPATDRDWDLPDLVIPVSQAFGPDPLINASSPTASPWDATTQPWPAFGVTAGVGAQTVASAPDHTPHRV